jgi:CRISPR/Cas system CSM-associated protein Csm4 (group 5 of RAMP superfamily)
MIWELRKNIETTTKFAGYRYSHYTKLNELIQSQPRNTIILITGIEINPDMRLLAHHNDLIYLDIAHPWESDPTSDILFSWQIVNIPKYLQEYKKLQNLKKNALKDIKASYLSISTQEDIVDALNIFFKKRYTHG